MPTYEYECTGCKKHFEFFQKISEPARSNCPDCSRPLKRLIGSGAGIIFKGAGFYATDYRKKNNKIESDSSDQSLYPTKKEEKKD